MDCKTKVQGPLSCEAELPWEVTLFPSLNLKDSVIFQSYLINLHRWGKVWLFTMVNSYVEIPNPKGDGISWWYQGRYLSWERELLMNGISTPREEAPESAPAPSTTSGHREGTSSEPRWQPFPGHNQAGVLILDSSASRNWGINAAPSLCYFVTEAWNKTRSKNKMLTTLLHISQGSHRVPWNPDSQIEIYS